MFCLLGCAASAKAQSVLTAPPGGYSTTPPAVQAEQATGAGFIPNWLNTATVPSPADLFNYGPVVAHPRASYQFLYGDGLQSSPGSPTKSIVQSVSPGVLFNIGSHMTVDYSPTLTFYSSKAFHDSLDQAASLSWGTSYEDWVVGVTQTYARSSDPLVQTATQTDSESFVTGLNVSYAINSKMSLSGAISQSILSADQFSSSKSWSTTEFLNYQFWPRFSMGIGGGYGYDSVNSGPDMSHESLQLQLNWRAFNKLSVQAHGGVEDRQFLHSGLSNLISPTYGAAITYDPFLYTAVSLSLDRGITPSITSGNQAAESTSLNIGLNQRLLKRLSLSVTGSYSQVNYLASALNVGPDRSDTYYAFSARLAMDFLRRASASISYQYNVNSSSTAGFTFASSQFGFGLSYRY